jgi:flagellar biogenesis protein FliO
MAVGMIVTLVGLAVRGFPFSRQDATGKASRKGIPTSYGLLLILAIIIFAIFAISRM